MLASAHISFLLGVQSSVWNHAEPILLFSFLTKYYLHTWTQYYKCGRKSALGNSTWTSVFLVHTAPLRLPWLLSCFLTLQTGCEVPCLLCLFHRDPMPGWIHVTIGTSFFSHESLFIAEIRRNTPCYLPVNFIRVPPEGFAVCCLWYFGTICKHLTRIFRPIGYVFGVNR